VQHDDGAYFKAKASRDDKLWAKMKGLLSLSSNSAEGGITEITSTRITTRRLKLESDYFNALKGVPEARRKMLDMCPVGGKTYLIVGTMSIQTATFKSTGTQRHCSSISSALPISAAAGAAGVPLLLSRVLDPQVGVQISNSSD
jgi:hypothetical protein